MHDALSAPRLLPSAITRWLVVGSAFLLASLHGTLIVLHDRGFTDDETIEWLLTPEESIGLAPIEALRAGRKSEVRRVAQSLG